MCTKIKLILLFVCIFGCIKTESKLLGKVKRGVVVGSDQNIKGHVTSGRHEDIIIDGHGAQPSARPSYSGKPGVGAGAGAGVGAGRQPSGARPDGPHFNPSNSGAGIRPSGSSSYSAGHNDNEHGQFTTSHGYKVQPSSGYHSGIEIGDRNSIKGAINAH